MKKLLVVGLILLALPASALAKRHPLPDSARITLFNGMAATVVTPSDQVSESQIVATGHKCKWRGNGRWRCPVFLRFTMRADGSRLNCRERLIATRLTWALLDSTCPDWSHP